MKKIFFPVVCCWIFGLNAQIDTLRHLADSVYIDRMFEQEDVKHQNFPSKKRKVVFSKESQKGIIGDSFYEGNAGPDKRIIYDEVTEGEGGLKGPSAFDSRFEPGQLDPNVPWQLDILKSSRSVAVIIEKEMLHLVEDSVFQLDISNTLRNRFTLCPGEPFGDQPVIGVGTGFIIGDMKMMTAGHVFLEGIEDYVVVFGFEMLNTGGAYQFLVHAKDVYYPRTIVNFSEEMDVAVFSVDRSFEHPPLKWATSREVPDDLMVYMIGHPMGLPKKIALNATVQGKGEALCFFTTLDAFQGNSGSPVFRSDTHEVIGVLVSGELDYEWSGSCNRSTLCRMPYCKGEKVIRIEQFMMDIDD